MSTTSPPPPSQEPSTGMFERLYVLWIVSSLMLVLLVVIVTVLGSGRLRRHAERISQQSQAIERLREELSQTRRELLDLKKLSQNYGTGVAPVSPPPRSARAQPMPPSSADQPLVSEQPVRDGQPESPASRVPEHAIKALLQSAIRRGNEGLDELGDRPTAEEALRLGLDAVGGAAWSGETWARLAALARLLDRDVPAETFAANARADKQFPRAYYELSARRRLAQGRAPEAIVFARLLLAGRPHDPAGALLLAEGYRLKQDPAAADVALEDLRNVERLSLADKLRLARCFVALERWERLDALLASLGNVGGTAPRAVAVPEAASAQVNYLRAVLAIQRGQLPEALAILDNLLSEPRPSASGQPAPGLPAPDDYELRTWRGVALLYAQQFQAAREALAVSEKYPDRPEAWYWLGVLELRAGNTDQAVPYLEHALAASYGFAPAWEALGTLALNQGDLATALEHLTKAVNANPRRASSHFLLAIIHAKASRPAEAAEALRTAFRLGPSLLETAKQTEVISRMFSADELDALAGVTRGTQDLEPE